MPVGAAGFSVLSGAGPAPEELVPRGLVGAAAAAAASFSAAASLAATAVFTFGIAGIPVSAGCPAVATLVNVGPPEEVYDGELALRQASGRRVRSGWGCTRAREHTGCQDSQSHLSAASAV